MQSSTGSSLVGHCSDGRVSDVEELPAEQPSYSQVAISAFLECDHSSTISKVFMNNPPVAEAKLCWISVMKIEHCYLFPIETQSDLCFGDISLRHARCCTDLSTQ